MFYDNMNGFYNNLFVYSIKITAPYYLLINITQFERHW